MNKIKYCIGISCLGGGILFAEGIDPITVSADHMTFEVNQRQGHYRGHVSLLQGSYHLEAENALTRLDKTQHLRYAKAFSKEGRTHFWTFMHPSDPTFHAYARSIEYFPTKQLLILSGNASLHQGKNALNAPVIRYHLRTHQVITDPTPQAKTHLLFYVDPHHVPSLRQKSKKTV